MSNEALKLADYPWRSHDTIRYCDTDRQGHVNNARFGEYLETGRATILNEVVSLAGAGLSFVLARTEIDYLHEINWPGVIEGGTRIASIGKTSLRIEQALFQNGQLCAKAVSVMVQIDNATNMPSPVSDADRERFLTQFG